MILTTREARKAMVAEIPPWRLKFAWLPTRVAEGVAVWLEFYERRRFVDHWERRQHNSDKTFVSPVAYPYP